MSGIYAVGSKVIGAFTKCKPMKSLANAFHKNPEKCLALTTIGSIVVKDGIGCYKYVTQSLNNKEIPEKRRKFVAAMDLTNGVLMIVSQIAMFFAIRKVSEPLFNKLFKKTFNPKLQKNIVSQIRAAQRKAGKPLTNKVVLNNKYMAIRKDALSTFKFIVDLAAATIIGKRIIVPLLATPLANKVEARMNKGSAKDNDNVQETKATKSFTSKETAGTNLIDNYLNVHQQKNA